MSILNRLRKLEQGKAASKVMSLVFLEIPGDSDADDYLSASIHGVGHIKRNTGETAEEFQRRAYAMEAAGRDLNTLSTEEQEAAFKTGDARRLAAGEPVNITIGGE